MELGTNLRLETLKPFILPASICMKHYPKLNLSFHFFHQSCRTRKNDNRPGEDSLTKLLQVLGVAKPLDIISSTLKLFWFGAR